MRESTWIRRPLRRLLCVLAVALAPVPVHAQHHFPPERDLEMMLRYLVEDGETPGIVLGVVEGDGSTGIAAYGGAGPEGDQVTPRSGFELGTLTMTFTAALLEEMVGRGEVSLDDPVSRYLPDHVEIPAPADAPITLRHLATHRSGLPEAAADVSDGMTLDELYTTVSRAKLEAVPGRRYAFSTLGYGLLGHALARAAGMDFPELLRSRVLDPLGMTRTGYAGESESPAPMARGHDDGDPVPDVLPAGGLLGATGLRSTGEDMLAYLAAYVGPAETPLQEAMRRATEVRFPRPEPEGRGFSWRTYSVARQPPIVAHGGAAAGFSSLIAFDPAQGIGTVLLANTRAFDDWIGRNLLFPDPPSSVAEARVDPAVLRRYVGTYEVGPDRYTAAHDRGRYYIRYEQDGYLTYQARGVVRTRLFARSDTSFYMVRGPYTVSFAPVGDNVRMTIRVDEREPVAEGRTWVAWRDEARTPPAAVVAGNAGAWTTWGVRTWALVAAVVTGGAALILRPLWSHRRVAA